MKPSSELRILCLAVIQEQPQDTLKRYQVMTKINHLVEDLQPPYSPGAVYHDLKSAATNKLIKVDHNSQVSITPEGLSLLHYELIETPLPRALSSVLTRILATLLLRDQSKRETSLRKLQIEMIKNSQFMTNTERSTEAKKASLDIWTHSIGQSLRKAVQALVAQI